MNYDVIVIGSGPGGYVAAIKSAQLGMKTAVVERENLGGICLNWGCIPTKALLKSAQVYNYINHASAYGVAAQPAEADLPAMVARSRGVAETMSKGVQFLLKKNNVEVLTGTGKVLPGKKVEVTNAEGVATVYEANHIIIATGARSRNLPNLPQDGKKIIGYREAMTLPEKPKTMVVVGSGAIASEFAFFYQSIGVQVTLVEFLPNVVPNEDEDVSAQISRSFRKMGMKVMTSASVEKVDIGGDICHGAKFAIDAIADGREGMVSINRFVHPGQSLTIGRDLRQFIEFNRDDITQPDSFDNAARQRPGFKPGEARATFADLRLPLTEEQVKIEANRCLGCGATTVDLNQCVGCGLCTTRCEFDAIHLSRDLPAASDMHTAEEMLKLVGPYALKRMGKIVKRKITGKSDYPTEQE